MIASKAVRYSPGQNDECLTPLYAVEAIVPYLNKKWRYWLPFDKEESAFRKVLIARGIPNVISHIDDNFNFLENSPPSHWDAILSNPPFTGKRRIFERALCFGKPFALLMSNTWLNDAAPKQLFRDRQLQLLMFEERMKFLGCGNEITFSTSYFCCDFLPQQIIMASLKDYGM